MDGNFAYEYMRMALHNTKKAALGKGNILNKQKTAKLYLSKSSKMANLEAPPMAQARSRV